ncbi:MAG: PadR family transcriptional regulator [Pseudonocardiaceae bacterium]
MYPILQRLRGAGWVSDRWEDPEPSRAERRHPRRYYRLTMEGRVRAIHALQHGRDRSGLSRLLAALATLPSPRSRRVRHEQSEGASFLKRCGRCRVPVFAVRYPGLPILSALWGFGQAGWCAGSSPTPSSTALH